ncbi:H-2 class II histocompatibility antigen, A-R alpha chain-like [Lampris incognitus]|uniref:H-2 class II histocompatibility antigen, A-R alpha chain-like n=1 Tax=Lampris incognitus TaxID=2546036 RepID=UPI0024B53B30|nr:H-2 class II histocompatibility antigen, A-R alpha chain-like [Lampris incognitus]
MRVGSLYFNTRKMVTNTVTVLAVVYVVSATAALHEGSLLYFCSESGDAEVEVLWDREQLLYADFEKEEAVWTAPMMGYETSFWPEFYPTAQISKDRICRHYLPKALEGDKSPPRAKAPQVVVYPKDEVKPGVDNTLLCYIRGFYPPPLNITWTRDGITITDGVGLGNLWLESDGTFTRLASLAFRPHTGVEYGCKVDHTALHQTAATIWVMEGRGMRSGPMVLCGVGLILGSFSLIIGIVLFMKALHLY